VRGGGVSTRGTCGSAGAAGLGAGAGARKRERQSVAERSAMSSKRLRVGESGAEPVLRRFHALESDRIAASDVQSGGAVSSGYHAPGGASAAASSGVNSGGETRADADDARRRSASHESLSAGAETENVIAGAGECLRLLPLPLGIGSAQLDVRFGGIAVDLREPREGRGGCVVPEQPVRIVPLLAERRQEAIGR
jgi:hypothetical protein